MKKKTLLGLIAVLSLITLTKISNAKNNVNEIRTAIAKYAENDSLLTKIENLIYYRYYNPGFFRKTVRLTLTVLRVDIDKNSKVIDIRFSDSADTTFVSAFRNDTNYIETKLAIEEYAKAKSYQNISILI